MTLQGKNFLGIFIFLILVMSSVQALVVDDLQTTIQTGNTAIQQSNAKITAQLTQLQENQLALEKSLTERDTNLLHRNDLDGIYGNIDARLAIAQNQMLTTNLLIIIFAIAIIALMRAKKML